MENNQYEVTTPSGKKWILQVIPKHFFLFFSQLPNYLTSVAVGALNEDAAKKAAEEMTPQEQMETAMFVREAVKFACVNPKITLTPKDQTEISPFSISEEDFEFLSKTAMQNLTPDQKKN